MKIFVISLLCAVATSASAGAVGWPGAVALSSPILKTYVPGETKTTAYSTTQYINALPSSYSFGAHPQLVYQQNSYVPFTTGYYSVPHPSYVPATNIFYPSQPSFIPAYNPGAIAGVPIVPSAPLAPNLPVATNPNFPAQSPNNEPRPPTDDGDSSVIESADFLSQQQQNLGTPSQPAPAQPFSPPYSQFPAASQDPQEPMTSFPANQPPNHQETSSTFSPFPQNPQNSQDQPQAPNDYPSISQQFGQTSPQNPPSFSDYPQISQSPQIPQNPAESSSGFPFPQYPQDPQIPNLPQNNLPQGPSQGSSSFPGTSADDSGINDEDTVSIESA